MDIKHHRALVLLALALGAGPGLGSAIVATIGPEKIDDVELNAKVAAEERNANHKLGPEQRQAILQALVNQRLLVARAKDEGLNKKDEVRRTVEDTERQILSNLVYEREVAEILGIPYERYTQAGMTPIAHFTGETFRPAERVPLDDITHWNGW